jgi:hypothetical protein
MNYNELSYQCFLRLANASNLMQAVTALKCQLQSGQKKHCNKNWWSKCKNSERLYQLPVKWTCSKTIQVMTLIGNVRRPPLWETQCNLTVQQHYQQLRTSTILTTTSNVTQTLCFDKIIVPVFTSSCLTKSQRQRHWCKIMLWCNVHCINTRPRWLN